MGIFSKAFTKTHVHEERARKERLSFQGIEAFQGGAAATRRSREEAKAPPEPRGRSQSDARSMMPGKLRRMISRTKEQSARSLGLDQKSVGEKEFFDLDDSYLDARRAEKKNRIRGTFPARRSPWDALDPDGHWRTTWDGGDAALCVWRGRGERRESTAGSRRRREVTAGSRRTPRVYGG